MHLHWVAGFINYDELAGLKKKVVWTLHDMNPFTGGCHYAGDCEQFLNSCVFCPQLEGTGHEKMVQYFFKKKLKSYSSISPVLVAPSQYLFSRVKQSNLFSDKECRYITNGIDETIFKPRSKNEARSRLGLPLEKKIILFVSDSLENKRKGFNLLMEALRSMSDSNLLLCAIGKTKEVSTEQIVFFGF